MKVQGKTNQMLENEIIILNLHNFSTIGVQSVQITSHKGLKLTAHRLGTEMFDLGQ